MKRIKHETKLPYPVDHVYETFRDNPEALAAKIPQLERIEILSREEPDPSRTRVRIRFHGKTAIPEIARPIVNPSMLKWVTEQDWDNNARTNCYRVQAAYFRELVNVGGKWTFCSDGNGGTCVTVEGHVNIRGEGLRGVPPPIARAIGDLVESFIMRNSGPNLKRMMDALEKLLQQNYPAQQAS